MKINLPKLAIGIVSLTLGFLISIQISANLHSFKNISVKQWSQQTIYMEELKKQNDKLVKEAFSLRNQLASESPDESKALNEKLSRVNITAGFTPMIGPGIVINLDDNPNPLAVDDNPNDYLIHDTDLLFVVNHLKSSGAEAISINEERIIGSSEIRCAGPTILVNTIRITPPFEIKVIGNPQVLEDAMRAEGGELQVLGAKGMKISIQKASKITIPAFAGILEYHYAKPNILN